MAQISRYKLNPQTHDQIVSTFVSTLRELSSTNKAYDFLEAIFTPTEITMLSKRLAAAYMLQKGATQRQVAAAIHLSPATVNNVSQSFKDRSPEIHRILENLIKKTELNKKIDAIGFGLAKALPPKGNWKSYYKNLYEEEKRSQKPL